MKILLVIHDFWPNYRAGTENATYFLAEELAKKHEVIIFTIEPNSHKHNFHEKYSEAGFNVIKIHQKSFVPSNLRDTYIREDLDIIFKKYIDEINPDVVHFQHLIGLSLNFISLVKEKKISIIYTIHDYWFQCPRIRRYYNGKNCLMNNSKRCNHCIANNFLFLGDKSGDFITEKIGVLLKKRYLKRITHILLNNFRLKFILNLRSRKNLIYERNKEFLRYFKMVDLFITPSKFLLNEVEKFGIKKKKILAVEHGIKIPKIIQSMPKKQSSSRIIDFFFISHITKDKGFLLLIDNFKKALKEQNNIRLTIYGSFDENDREIVNVFKEIRRNKSIEYKGVFDNRNIQSILAKADVIIVPSIWNEIYGLVVDEAYLYGKTVIVSSRGGMPERVKPGINGFVFDPQKRNDLYEKIIKIAKKPKILNKFIKNSPSIKSIKQYAKEIEAIYRNVKQ